MGGIDKGLATAEVEALIGIAAEAEALIGIAAMKSTIMVVVVLVDGMMIGIVIMEVGAGGTGVSALTTGEDEVEAPVEGVIEALLGKAVRRGVLKLPNGTGKGNNRKVQKRSILTLAATTIKVVIMAICKMAIRIMDISGFYHSKEYIDINQIRCLVSSLALFCDLPAHVVFSFFPFS